MILRVRLGSLSPSDGNHPILSFPGGFLPALPVCLSLLLRSVILWPSVGVVACTSALSARWLQLHIPDTSRLAPSHAESTWLFWSTCPVLLPGRRVFYARLPFLAG